MSAISEREQIGQNAHAEAALPRCTERRTHHRHDFLPLASPAQPVGSTQGLVDATDTPRPWRDSHQGHRLRAKPKTMEHPDAGRLLAVVME